MLLVEKLSPRLGLAPRRGDLVFFQPPARLREIADGRRVAAGQARTLPLITLTLTLNLTLTLTLTLILARTLARTLTRTLTRTRTRTLPLTNS